MFQRAFLVRRLSGYAKRKALNVGDSVSTTRQVTKADVESFCKLSGDTNSVHVQKGDEEVVVHGALLNGLVSGVIGTMLPGPGTLVVSQNLNYPNKCFANETVKITVRLASVRRIIDVEFSCEVEDRKQTVLFGDARVVISNL